VKQVGLPLTDLPAVERPAPAHLEEPYREAEARLNNVRSLAAHQTKKAKQVPTQPVDRRHFNVPPKGNPDLFEKVS
jgi:hypothetical protein